MSRNWPPPPPKARPGTLDDLIGNDPMKHSKLNDIDGDDDESTEISDNDSILAMAKRLDEASVISDPSFIEGAAPHVRGVDPGGLGGMRGDGYGSRGPGGLYAQHRDLDSIASESESDSGSSSSSSSSSGSDSSFERNPNRGRVPMGQPRVGFHDGSGNYRPGPNYSQPPPNQYQQNYRGGPPPGPYQGGDRPPPGGSGYYPDRGGYNNYNNGGNGGPEYNDNKNVRFSDRGQQRVYRDEELEPSKASRSRGRSRSRSPSRESKGSKASSRKSREEDERRERKRKIKLIVIPIIILAAIGAAVAVAVIVGKQGGDENASTTPDAPKFEFAVPTTSPIYIGLYNCPVGTTGPVPTKGCIGYVQCDGMGGTLGEVLLCPSGTLYDVRNGICNHIDQVTCSTRLPTSDELDGVTKTPDPTPNPTPRPTNVVSFEVVPPLIGPTTTYGHRLAFLGVSTPGNMALFEQNLVNYLRLFYSPGNLAALDEDDELRSVSDVSIDVSVVSLERRRRLGGAEDLVRASVRRKRREGLVSDESRLLQTDQFIAVYDQTTTYRTSDPSVTIGAIVRGPFEPEYTATLIEHLIRRDPGTFGTLTDIVFVEGDEPLPEPVPAPTTATPTAAETAEPTKIPTKQPVETPVETEEPTPFLQDETDSPTKRRTNPPSPSPTASVIAFPTLSTIQGLLWLDEDGDGLFSTNEPPMEGTFVNLRECEGDRWKATSSANAIGQYQFVGVEEGRYYVDFFKPAPADRYEFTIPKVGGDNDMVLDSDVVRLEGSNGQSDCMEVGEGFKKLTNAGYRLKATPAPAAAPVAAAQSKAPTVPRFCADVIEGVDGAPDDFDFRGCTLPCTSINHEDCPDGMLCALTRDCS